jgi:hypothetical protein
MKTLSEVERPLLWAKILGRTKTVFATQFKIPCWICSWGKNGGGYPRISFAGTDYYTHRTAYLVFQGGDIPKGMDVHHKCGNKACVNPNHLELTTRSQHMRLHWAMPGMLQKARERALKRWGNPKNEVTAREIVAFRKQELLQQQIANKVGCSQSHVSKILRGPASPSA